VTAGETGLTRIDVRRPDGTGAIQAGGPESTPTIPDAVALDRFVPLVTDRSDGTGLTVFDAMTHNNELVAVNADNVRAQGGYLWWTTGSASDVVWHCLDLRALL
jgi:hypothetical protein